jgi:hypothetical protein
MIVENPTGVRMAPLSMQSLRCTDARVGCGNLLRARFRRPVWIIWVWISSSVFPTVLAVLPSEAVMFAVVNLAMPAGFSCH